MMMTSQNSLLTSWYNYLLPIVSDVRNKVFSQGLEKQIHLSNNQDFSCNQKYDIQNNINQKMHVIL